MLAVVLTNVLQDSRVSKKVQNLALRQLEQVTYVTGTVIGFTTSEQVEKASIGTSYPKTEVHTFSHPPNDLKYAAEFKRAQNEDRSLSVAYRIDENGNNLIDFVMVYAAEADPASNKRNR